MLLLFLMKICLYNYLTVILDKLTIENALIQKSKKPNASKPPNKDLRIDRIEHWSIDAPTRSRCKIPSCNGYTWQECEKCQVGLCVGKGKTCFILCHLIM